MIRITSKRDGFRRAGMAHAGIRDYPDGRFSPKQLAALQAEPLLLVEVLPEGISKPGKGKTADPVESTEADEATA